MAQRRVYFGKSVNLPNDNDGAPTTSIVDTLSTIKELFINDHHVFMEEGLEGMRGVQTWLDASCQSTVTQWTMWPGGQSTTHKNLGDTVRYTSSQAWTSATTMKIEVFGLMTTAAFSGFRS